MYDALLVSVERQFDAGLDFRASYTLAKAFNYANDDQIPFSAGPLDPNDLQRDYGPTPNDRRHRFTLRGHLERRRRACTCRPIWTIASGVPMDILMPDGPTRIPVLQRNAGDRQFKTAGELNAFIQDLNAKGGIDGVAAAARVGRARSSATRSTRWTCACRGRSPSATRPDRADGRGLQRVQRDEHPRRRRT